MRLIFFLCFNLPRIPQLIYISFSLDLLILFQRKHRHMSEEPDPQKPNESIEVKFVFSSDGKEKKAIKVKPSSTLKEVRKDESPVFQGYAFLNKDKTPIQLSDQSNYTVENLMKNNQIFLAKKDEPKKQLKTYVISFKSGKHKKMQIKAAQNDTLATVASENSELSQFYFLSKNGSKLSSSSAKTTLVKDVVGEKNTIYMGSKVEEDTEAANTAKNEKIQQEQRKKIKNLGELIKDVEGLKKDGDKQKMKQIADKLKEYSVDIQPTKLSDEHSLKSVIQTLQGKQSDCQNIINFAKDVMQNRSDADCFTANGLILPTIYNTKKKHPEIFNLVDFSKTKKTDNESLRKGYKISIIQYEATQNSSAHVDLTKSSQFEFQKESLNVSAWSVSAKLQNGKAELHESQNITATKNITQGERMNQIFMAFAITSAVHFHKDDIVLKSEVVEKFEQIVAKYKDSKQANRDKQLEAAIGKYVDKYGIGVSSSLYYLGGVYHNTINYQFFSAATSSDVSRIISNETQHTLGAAAGVSYGPFSAEAGYQNTTKSTGVKAFKDKQASSEVKYKTTYYHEASPLSSIQDINVWRETVEAFPKNWTIVGFKNKTEVPLTQLLRTEQNSYNHDPDFLKVKEQVLQAMPNIEKFVDLKVEFGHHPNFLVHHNSIRKVKNPNSYAQITGSPHFPLDSISTFTLEVVYSASMDIAIGICSTDCKKKQFSKPTQDEVIFYQLKGSGSCENKNQKVVPNQITVKIKDKIKVVVDTTALSTISWFANEKLAGQLPIPGLMIKKRIFPFVQMYDDDDVLRVL